jgi:hypothetical protein
MIGLDASSPHDPYTPCRGRFSTPSIAVSASRSFQRQSRATEVNSFPPKIRSFQNPVSKITLETRKQNLSARNYAASGWK